MFAYLLCAVVCFCECPLLQPRDQLSRGAHSSLYENSSLQSLALSRADTQTLSTSAIAAENSGIISNPTETQASKHCGSSGGAHVRSPLSTLYIPLVCYLPLLFSMVPCACCSECYSIFLIFTLTLCVSTLVTRKYLVQSGISHGCSRLREDGGRGYWEQFPQRF